MSAERIRCRACGESVEAELGQIDAAIGAASASSGELRIVYSAVGRTMLERLAAELEIRRRSIDALEAEIARLAAGGVR